MKKLWNWWRKPAVKTAVVGAAAAAVNAAAAGAFGPKGVAISAGLTALWSLFVKRPQDSAAEAKDEALAERLNGSAEGLGLDADRRAR
jgi:hypothetical protein